MARSSSLTSQLTSHVEFLASPPCQGRAPGTEGAALARDYLLGAFGELGLRPKGEDGYLQPILAMDGANLLGTIEGRNVSAS